MTPTNKQCAGELASATTTSPLSTCSSATPRSASLATAVQVGSTADTGRRAAGAYLAQAIRMTGWRTRSLAATTPPIGRVRLRWLSLVLLAATVSTAATAAPASVGATAVVAAIPMTDVVAWGCEQSNFGQCDVPVDLSDVTAVAAGGYHSMALKGDGTVVAWGDNSVGETNVPAGLTGVRAIAAHYHSLALKGDGSVVAWGLNSYGQTNVPADLSDVTAIAAGWFHSLALKRDGTVIAWGGSEVGAQSPPAGLSGVIAIDAGSDHNLALKSDGTVVAWGFGYPVPMGLNGVTAIAVGGGHSLALKMDGTVVAWGDNSYGQATVPPGLNGVVATSAGAWHSLALKSDGTVVAWGSHYVNSGLASAPAGLRGVRAIAAGFGFNLALVALGSGRSVSLSGAGAYAQARHSPDLNLAGDWTVEAWFKDEDPSGFNHEYVTLLNKGDRDANPEAPFFISLGYKRLVAGLRSNWTDQVVSYDLWAAGVDPQAWHHLAVSFASSTRTLTVYLGGAQVARGRLGSLSKSNALPVEIGRNGAVSGKYFRGKLDDVRIWNVARQGTDIAATYRAQLDGSRPGLIANWRFDEGGGTFAADSSGNQHEATLYGGATFSIDVHP